jgi:SAM-dependent methyltransferase
MSKLTDVEDLTRRTYDAQAAQWVNGHDEPEFWGEDLAKFHKLLPSGKILEIGSGGGRDAADLLKLGYEYTGTDISSGLLELARQRNPGAEFKEVSLYDLDFPEPFDGFWCAAVLLHIPRERIDEALSAITKNVRTDGIGFIAIKQGEGEGVEEQDIHRNSGRFFTYWQDEDFQSALTRNGLSVIEHGYRPMNERTKWLTYHVRLDKL